MTIKEHRMLKESIDRLVKETIEELKSIDSNLVSEDGENGGEDVEKNSKQTKRSTVIHWLRNDELNNAEIMRQLWNPDPEDEDAKRSEFSKKVRGEDADGKPYSFSDAEINHLYSIKSDSEVS